MYRPRSLEEWNQQYGPGGTASLVHEALAEPLAPRICAPLDLVVLRLHTAAGHPTPTLNHADYQLDKEGE